MEEIFCNLFMIWICCFGIILWEKIWCCWISGCGLCGLWSVEYLVIFIVLLLFKMELFWELNLGLGYKFRGSIFWIWCS